MENEKTYTINADEGYLEFVRRVIADQPDREPLRIVEQLMEIAVGEVMERMDDLSAVASDKRLTVTLRHSGKQIDGRLILIMGDNTDRVDYKPDGDEPEPDPEPTPTPDPEPEPEPEPTPVTPE